MIPKCLRSLSSRGAEVSVIADPREILVDCRGCDIRDEDLSGLQLERDLTHVWLDGCKISDDAILQLRMNPRLEALYIGSTRATWKILRIVPHLPHLAGLGIDHMTGVDLGIEYLSDHPALETLDLSYTDITGPNLARLLVHSRLTDVDVIGTSIIGSDVVRLDDLDADPYRTVTVHLGESDRVSIVMGFTSS